MANAGLPLEVRGYPELVVYTWRMVQRPTTARLRLLACPYAIHTHQRLLAVKEHINKRYKMKWFLWNFRVCAAVWPKHNLQSWFKIIIRKRLHTRGTWNQEGGLYTVDFEWWMREGSRKGASLSEGTPWEGGPGGRTPLLGTPIELTSIINFSMLTYLQ
jgi:hypothetical protein